MIDNAIPRAAHHDAWIRGVVAVGLLFLMFIYAGYLVFHSFYDWVSDSQFFEPLLLLAGGAGDSFPLAMGLVALGALVQTWRAWQLRRHGMCHPHCARRRRTTDLLLCALAVVMLIPAIEGNSSKWADPTYYPYTVAALVMAGTSWWCVLATNRWLTVQRLAAAVA